MLYVFRVLLVVFFLWTQFSCQMQSGNSFQFDEELFALGSGPLDDLNFQEHPEFAGFYQVIQSKCLGCHNYKHGFTSLNTPEAWKNSSYISPGNPNNSMIYARIRSESKSGDMPPQGMLLNSESQAVASWILSLADTSSGPPPEGDNEALKRTQNAQAALLSCMGCHVYKLNNINSDFFKQSVSVPEFGIFFNTISSADSSFVTSGMVQVGNADNSWIYAVLKGHGSVGSMPPGNSPAISNANATAIEEWINKMGQ